MNILQFKKVERWCEENLPDDHWFYEPEIGFCVVNQESLILLKLTFPELLIEDER